MDEYKKILTKRISRLFIVLWPPWGEEMESDVSISFGFVFRDDPPNQLCIISVDKDELWSPHLYYSSIPNKIYPWQDFYTRIELWMKAQEDTDLIMNFEYYEVTDCEIFENIIDSEIIELELLFIKNIDDPFGIKIIFKNDYIISTPNSDGNTIETKKFNRINNIENFKHLGDILKYKMV